MNETHGDVQGSAPLPPNQITADDVAIDILGRCLLPSPVAGR